MSRWIAVALMMGAGLRCDAARGSTPVTLSTPATRPATSQPAEPLVSLHYLNAIIVDDWTITVSKDGQLRSIDDPSFGVVHQGKVEFREGQLTPAQLKKLSAALQQAIEQPKPPPRQKGHDAVVLIQYAGKEYETLEDPRFDKARAMIVKLAKSSRLKDQKETPAK